MAHSPQNTFYDAPYLLAQGDVPLPEGTFLLPICTTIERFGKMFNALMYANMIQNRWGDMDHAIDLLEAMAYVQQPSLSPCMPEVGDCYDFLPELAAAAYYPNDPFQTPGLYPPGYILPPWYTNADFSLPGVISTDAMVNGLALPIGANWIDLIVSGFPRVRFSVYGPAECEIELIQVPQGGIALITTDDNPLTAEIVDLSSIGIGSIASLGDLLSAFGLAFDLSATSTIVHEVEFTTVGPHWIDVTFLPNVDTEVIVGFGGGIRRFTRCGSALIGGEDMSGCCPEPTNQRYTADGVLEISYDGGQTWTTDDSQDPRFNSPELPPLTTAGDVRCNSAVGASNYIQETIINNLDTGMAVAAIIGVIASAAAILGSFGTATPLVTALGSAIGVAGVAAVDAALTAAVWEDFECLVFCNMDADGRLDRQRWLNLIDDIDTNFTGLAWQVLHGTVIAIGPVGMTNAGRVQQEASQSCVSCGCEENWCRSFDFTASQDGWINSSSAVWSAGGWSHSGSSDNFKIATPVLPAFKVHGGRLILSGPMNGSSPQGFIQSAQGAAITTRQIISGSQTIYTFTAFTPQTWPQWLLGVDPVAGIASGQRANVRIIGAMLWGSGVNPFGSNNCEPPV